MAGEKKALGIVNAVRGILYALKTQVNLKIQFLAAIVVVFTAGILQVSRTDWLWLLAAIFFVFVAELFNTALEKLSDLITNSYNSQIRLAKDIAAGAVLMAVIFSLVVAFFVFGNYVIKLISFTCTMIFW